MKGNCEKERKGYIVFDLDGTLVNSYQQILLASRIVLENWLGREISQDEFEKGFHKNPVKFYSNFGIDVGLPEKRKKIEQFWEEASLKVGLDVPFFPEIEELLLKVKNLGFGIYIWTARDKLCTHKILNNLGLFDFFDGICCGDETLSKPDPQGLERLVGEYPREKVIVVGDSETDIQGAKKFGCRVIAALWCFSAEEDVLAQAGADFFVQKPLDCLGIFQQYLSKEN
jgi:HAD superfamily hydrolase (TIGR01549 family)